MRPLLRKELRGLNMLSYGTPQLELERCSAGTAHATHTVYYGM
jgi:hypothetical protein